MLNIMNRSLLSTVFQQLRSFGPRYKEEQDHVWLGRPGDRYAISTSISGVAYCLVNDKDLTGVILKVDRQVVAEGQLEILLWILEHASETYRETVRISAEYNRKHPKGK